MASRIYNTQRLNHTTAASVSRHRGLRLHAKASVHTVNTAPVLPFLACSEF